MTQYVVGFAFNETKDKVALIRKLKPAWQKGKFNGIGGKIEPKEEPIKAMVREFEEETGYSSSEQDWNFFCELYNEYFSVFCYWSVLDLSKLKTVEEEEVVILETDNLTNIISNLTWLIPLAKDKDVIENPSYNITNIGHR